MIILTCVPVSFSSNQFTTACITINNSSDFLQLVKVWFTDSKLSSVYFMLVLINMNGLYRKKMT